MSARGSRIRSPPTAPRPSIASTSASARYSCGTEIDFQPVLRAGARPWTGRRRRACVLPSARRSRGPARRRAMNGVDRVAAREDRSSRTARVAAQRGVERAVVVGRRDPDHRGLHGLRAGLASGVRRGRRPVRAARVTRTRRPKSGRASNQRRCSRRDATRPTTRIADRRSPASRACAARVPSVPLERPLRRQRAVVDERGRLARRAAVRHERLQHRPATWSGPA